jgi:hypothetical protein
MVSAIVDLRRLGSLTYADHDGIVVGIDLRRVDRAVIRERTSPPGPRQPRRTASFLAGRRWRWRWR